MDFVLDGNPFAQALTPRGTSEPLTAEDKWRYLDEFFDTEMARVLSPQTMQSVIDQTPLGRLGTPEEMANVIRFLLSEESSFITGDTLDASGGRVMLP